MGNPGGGTFIGEAGAGGLRKENLAQETKTPERKAIKRNNLFWPIFIILRINKDFKKNMPFLEKQQQS